MSRSIEDVISDLRGEAATLRRNGHAAQAASMERVLDELTSHPLMRDVLTWLDEGAAQSRSAKGVDFLRGKFGQWAEDRLAEQRGRRRYYRRIAIPRRKLESIQRAEAARDVA